VLTILLAVVLVAAIAVALQGLRARHKLQREVSKLVAVRADAGNALGKRDAFVKDLEYELQRCDRTGRPATLVLIRLSAGQLRGGGGAGRPDLAEVIAGAVRSIDIAYRIGPSEIALIVPETRARGALVAVGRLEERLLAAGVPSSAVTIGVAELGPGVDRRQLCREAYCALLVAGSDGRPRILTYSPELERAARSRGLEGLGEVESSGGPAI
jgi:GGDEF domain-containing protein